MKSVLIFMCVMLIAVLQSPAIAASEVKEYRAEAARYYEENNYKKAYKVYFKLAKIGDHYSQNKLSQMFVDGKGKKVDLTEAYAWSVLAAESGVEGIKVKSEKLLQQTDDKAVAEKRASKLLSKYGKDALLSKAERREMMKYNHKSGGCTGSKLGCSGR